MDKVYQSHMHVNGYEYVIEFQKNKLSKDRFYMGKMILPSITILNDSGVTKYQNFFKLFKDAGIKSKLMSLLIDDFQNYINSLDHSKKIHWIVKRESSKSNCGEKNIIFNRLALEYPNEFQNFIYFRMNMMILKLDKRKFFNELMVMIDKVQKQANLNNFLKFFN